MTDSFKNGMDHLPEQLYQVITADKTGLFQIMQEGLGELLLAALRNPALDENHVMALLKRRGLPKEVFNAVFANKNIGQNQGIKRALACHPDTPIKIAASLLSLLGIFELLKITLMPSIPSDHRVAAERCIIQRVPTQPLGNKLTLARRGTAAVVEALLKEAFPRLVEACLDNPRLKEGAVHQFISSGASTAETISMIGRNARWKGRPNIRLAMLKNPRTPQVWFTLFLPGLPPATLRDLLSSPRLTQAQKELVRQVKIGSSC